MAKIPRRPSRAAIALALRQAEVLWKPPPYPGCETAPVLATPRRRTDQNTVEAAHLTTFGRALVGLATWIAALMWWAA